MSRDPASLSVRQMNRLRVIEMLYRQPGSSRTDLARWTGLSRATVSALIQELGHAGVVEEREGPAAAGPRPGGRPPVLLSLVPRAAFAVGLDFGHQHIRVAICDLSGELVAEVVARRGRPRAHREPRPRVRARPRKPARRGHRARGPAGRRDGPRRADPQGDG